MEDKEVGELWKRCTGIESSEIVQLIRKLVEERAHVNALKYYRIVEATKDEVGSCITSALRDFGIDPATWTKLSN